MRTSTKENNHVLVVGMNPGGYKTITKGDTLSRLGDWLESININRYSFMNCVDTPGKVKLEDVNYNKVVDTARDYNKIIALGNFVSEVLDVLMLDHFKLPHPSGLNRKINDKQYIEQELNKCRNYINER